MTYAIRFHQPGGPEVLRWEEVQVPAPAAGEATVRHHAVGLNFVDIYNRSGLYPAQLPSGLGSEAAGVVEEVGPGVTDLKPGDRVAYGASPLGAYSEARLIPADRLLKLPDGVDDQTAAAMMLKGLTTQSLIRQTYRVKAGDTILLHAAAGGVGTILSQWAKHLGATVIGTVSNDEKLFESQNAAATVAAQAAQVARMARNDPETSASLPTSGPAARRTSIPADNIKPICREVRPCVSKNAGQNGDETP